MNYYTYQCQAGGGGAKGRIWPGGSAFELSCCPGVGIFEFLFLPVTTNHFLGWGISVIFDLTFLPGVGNFTAIFWKMSKSRSQLSHLLGSFIPKAADVAFVSFAL